MAKDNSFKINLQVMFDKVKSLAIVQKGMKAIEAKLSKLKMVFPKLKVDADTTVAENKIETLEQKKTIIQTEVDNSKAVSELKAAQKETKTFWDKFVGDAIKTNLIRMSVQRVIEAIMAAVAAVKELDTIKTNIQMASGASDSDVNAMMSSYNAMAKELSLTTKDVAEAANELLGMGERIENVNELIRSSQILSKVGMIQSTDAASYLIASLKGYQVAAEDSLDIVNKLTSVDSKAAVSAGGLAEAISRCSNAANNSGTSMDRLIGYTAAVGEAAQESMSAVGNAFKSIYSRMNNIKIGRLIDDESGESLSDTEAALNKLGIQLRDTADTYRSFDEVLNDIGSRWKDFSQAEQNAISVAIAGTMQRNQFLVLMNNWTKALEYSETAANSAGSALERYGVYQNSIEAKTNELTAAIESLYTNTMSEGLYSEILEATTGIVKFLDALYLVKASLAGLIAMGASKAIVSVSTWFMKIVKSAVQLSEVMALFDKKRSAASLQSVGAACKGLNDNQLKLILSMKGLKTQQRLAILDGMELDEQERKQKLATLGFAAAEDKAMASTFSLRGAFRSLRAVIATHPFGAFAIALGLVTTVFSIFKKKQEEVAQELQDSISQYDSAKSSLESINTELEEQTQKTDELLSKDKLTYAEKGQLEQLQAITKELLLQQDIGQRRVDSASKEAAANTIKAYKKQYGRYDKTEEDLEGKLSGEIFPLPENDDDILGNIAAYIRAAELLEKSQKDYQDALDNGRDSTGLANDIQYYINMVGDYSQVLDDSISDLQEKRAVLENEYKKAVGKRVAGIEGLTTFDKEIIKTYESMYGVIKMFYEYVDQNAWNNMEISNIFNTDGIEKTKDELVSMYHSGELSSAEMLEQFPKLNQAIKESEIIAGESSNALKEVFNEIAALAEKQAGVGDNASKTSTFSEQLATTKDSLDKYQSSVKSASDAYAKLLSGSYSSSDLLDSIQAVSQAVADMGGTMEWESINSMEELGEAIQEASEAYLDSFLKDNNISADSKFAKMLANIADEMYRVQAAYDSFNNSIDTIQSTYDKLNKAVSEYNTGGYVTLDTLQSVLSINNEYISCLMDENGKLVLNEEMYEKLTLAKLADAKSTIIQEGIQQLENIALSNSTTASGKAAEAADTHAEKLNKSVERIKRHTRAVMEDSAAAAANNEVLSGGTIDDLEAAYQKAFAVNQEAAEDAMSAINAKLALVDSAASNTASLFDGLSGASSTAAKETKEAAAETFNWIETALSRIQRTIKNLSSTVSSTWKSWTTRNTALVSELSEVRKEIELQKSAYDSYMQKADSVGLSGEYRQLVRSGSVSIEAVTDDTLKGQIKEYKEYYEKALDCKDAVSELKDKLAELAKLKFDHISAMYDAKIQDIDHVVNLVNGQMEQAEERNQTAGASFYEALISRENARIESLTNEYSEKLAAMNEAVSSGTVKRGSEAWQDMKSDIDGITESIQEANTQVLKYENSIKEIAELKFDSLETQFDSALSIITAEMSQLDKQAALVEEAGYLAGESFYNAMIESEKAHTEALIKEYDTLSLSLREALDNGSVKKFDENWFDMTGSIYDVEDALLDAQAALIKYGNSLRELKWDVFDRMQESISGFTEESDFLIGLMDKNSELFHENGAFNDRGAAIQGLHAVNYDVYMRQAQEYADAVREINSELADDPDNIRLQDRYRELLKLQREAILNAEDEKSAIKDLISEGYEKMLSFFDKLISARKEALDEEKSLHDYEKTVSNQAAEVAKYQKILDAYKGDDSEGMKAIIQKAQENLTKAQEELSETEYDKYMSDQEVLLDTFRNELEEWVNIRLDDINVLLQQTIEAVNANALAISGQINTDLNAVGMKLTENFARIFEIDYSGGTRDIVSEFFAGGFRETAAGVNTAISEVKAKSDEIKLSTDQVSSVLNQRFPELVQSMPNLSETNNKIADVVNAVNLVKEAVAAIRTEMAELELSVPDYGGSNDNNNNDNDDGWDNHWDNTVHGLDVTYTPAASSNQIQAAQGTGSSSSNAGIKKPVGAAPIFHEGKKPESLHFRYYKNGCRKLPNGEVAVTQEDGTESIISPLRGGMLTPLCKGDSVMTAEESDNLYKIAQMPAEELKNKLYKNYPPKATIKSIVQQPVVPVNNNHNTVTSSNQFDVTFHLPNVRTTDELYNAMGSETRFTRLIQGVAADGMLGKSRGPGYKYF